MNQPLVSIVLPTYNGARYVAQSIQSCIDQNYKNWELIIVDDCSTDETPQIIAQFVKIDPRIRSIRHETNRKLPAALNTGFAEAKGEFFSWTSDDNLYLPDAIRKMSALLEAQKGVGLVYCDYFSISNNNEQIMRCTLNEPEILIDYNGIGCCFLYRKDVAEKVGIYNEKYFLAEDYDFWLRLSLETKLLPLHEPLYLYRVHDEALSSTHRDKVPEVALRSLVENLPKMTWVGGEARARRFIQLSRAISIRRDLILKLTMLANAMKLRPLLTLRTVIINKLGSLLGLSRIFDREDVKLPKPWLKPIAEFFFTSGRAVGSGGLTKIGEMLWRL